MTANDIHGVKDALARAKANLDAAVARLAGKHRGDEMEAYDAASQRLLEAERQLAAAEGRPYAVPEELSLPWDVGAPLPTLVQSDTDVYLLFLLRDEEEQVGLIKFELCFATTFGSPGDETLAGHPLHGSGFEPYQAMRVISSPWIEELRQIDSVHPRHNDAHFLDLQHFVFPFHDTTFECVARSYAASRESGPLADAVRRAVDRLF